MNNKRIFITILIITFLILINIPNYLIKGNNSNNNDVDEEENEPIKTVLKSELKTDVDIDYKFNTNLSASAYDNEYKRLFKLNEISKVNINMYDKNYTYLLENAKDKPYILADSISFDDVNIGYVGIKTKGNDSLKKAKLSKYSLTVDTNKFVKKQLDFKQNLFGISKISLNNMNEDTTFFKDYLSYLLMSELGVCTPYFSIVELSVNNEYKGIHLLLENMEDELINRCFSETGNFFAKPEPQGGDLVYDKELDKYLDKDGNYNFDIDSYSDKNNVLQKYSGILEEKNSGEEITDEDVDKDKLNYELNTLFKWMKKLNKLSNMKNKNTKEFENEVESIIHIEPVIKYFAALEFLVSNDSYIGTTKKNYGLYIDSNMKMNIIPWDFNLSFGNTNLTAHEMINHRIDKPGVFINIEERPLLNIIVGNDKYRKMYYNYLSDCASIVMGGEFNGKTYEQNNFINIIDSLNDKLVNIMDQNIDFYTKEEHELGIYTLKEVIRLRAHAIKQQLNGNFKKVRTNVNLTNLGREIYDTN